ncbi:MAG: hypothetical protein GTO08_08455 [Deltaproteobacteria bacterium]|nr:hypothetical protein [Deltaproteobacteria bacterium]
MGFLLKTAKLALALLLAIILALFSGFIAERVLNLLVPSIFQGAGHVIKVVVIVIFLPLYFYLVESYFIRKEKGK